MTKCECGECMCDVVEELNELRGAVRGAAVQSINGGDAGPLYGYLQCIYCGEEEDAKSGNTE